MKILPNEDFSGAGKTTLASELVEKIDKGYNGYFADQAKKIKAK